MKIIIVDLLRACVEIVSKTDQVLLYFLKKSFNNIWELTKRRRNAHLVNRSECS